MTEMKSTAGPSLRAPFGAAAPLRGAKGLLLIRVDAHHLGDATSRLILFQVEKEGRERDQVAALVASGEITPAAGAKVDLEAARLVVRPLWISGNSFPSLAATVRKPPGDDCIGAAQGSGGNSLECDATSALHNRPSRPMA